MLRSSHHRRRLVIERLESRALLAALPADFTEAAIGSGLTDPTAMEIAPNGDLWVLEQAGLVKRFRMGSNAADIVGDIGNLGLDSDGERGLLGIAFDPQFAANKQVYLYYTATSPAIHNRISRFTVNDSDATDYFFAGTSGGDAGATGAPTQSILFNLDNLGATNHNGGAIHFGPDGKLYVAAGENAHPANAQSLANVLGKILRINSDGTIPADNPFVSSTSGKQQAIWALGLRNPYTFAFQPGTGRMFINDVGQDTWEEIDEGIAGSNYGWPSIEGNQGTPPSGPGTYRGPLYTYLHGSGTFEGEAITGGAFYNPAVQQFPSQFSGDYFFADFVNSWINVLDVPSGTVTQFATGTGSPVDLRVASDGSLYYLSRDLGQVLRVAYPLPNHAPTLASIDDQTIPTSGTGTVGFTIGDSETPPAALIVTVTSNNSALLPAGSLVLGGTGANRTLSITPASGQSDIATVQLTVSDGSLTASRRFFLTVSSEAHPWHNPLRAYDVNADGNVFAADALMVIDLLNSIGPGQLAPPGPASAPPPYVDVFPDNVLAPRDALLIINELNSEPPSAGEGERAGGGGAWSAAVSPIPAIDSLLAAAAGDLDAAHRRSAIAARNLAGS